MVAKITPIPRRTGNSTYIIPDISSALLAADYNSQAYFELTEDEYEKCIMIGTRNNQRLCSLTVINSMEHNSSCVVDEMFGRPEETSCALREVMLTKLSWRRLYMYTWMFTADQSTVAAVKCNGNREDLTLRGIGIINIDQECIIQTRKNTLTAELQSRVKITATLFKAMNYTWVPDISSSKPHVYKIDTEPVLNPCDSLMQLTTDTTNQEPENLFTPATVWITVTRRYPAKKISDQKTSNNLRREKTFLP